VESAALNAEKPTKVSAEDTDMKKPMKMGKEEKKEMRGGKYMGGPGEEKKEKGGKKLPPWLKKKGK